jgi:transcriptional regulator with XRE-family HTH domain
MKQTTNETRNTLNPPHILEPSAQVAYALRGLRRERKWSLDEAARQTGVSKAMLGQIERQESSPTIATLWKIVQGFRASISSFIQPGTVVGTQTLDHVVQASTVALHADPLDVRVLFAYQPIFGFELLELTMPSGTTRLSEPHESGVVEHVMAIDGPIEILSQNKWTWVPQHGAMRFAADVAHGYRNLTSNTVMFHNLIHYPDKAGMIRR